MKIVNVYHRYNHSFASYLNTNSVEQSFVIMTSEWNDREVLNFIDEFKKYRFLWDPKDTNRKSKNKKNDAYRELSVNFKRTPEDIKKKICNLLQSYRGYRRKIKTSKVSGAGRKDVFKPTWFAFDAINQFMDDVYTPHGTTDTLVDSSESNDENDDNDSINNGSCIEITEDNFNITEDENEGQKNSECSTEQTKTSTFTAPKTPRKKKKIQKDKNEMHVSQAYEYLMQKQKERQNKIEKDEFDIYGALVATKLRKMDELTRQCVMNKMDNLMFKAIIHSTNRVTYQHYQNNVQPHQFTAFNNVHQPSPSTSQFSPLNNVQQQFLLQSQLSTLNTVQQPSPSPSQSTTFSDSSQVSPSLNNSAETSDATAYHNITNISQYN